MVGEHSNNEGEYGKWIKKMIILNVEPKTIFLLPKLNRYLGCLLITTL